MKPIGAVLSLLIACFAHGQSSDLNGQWKVTKRICANGEPAVDRFGIERTKLVISGEKATLKALFVLPGQKAIPVDVKGIVNDRALVFMSDRGYGAFVVNYEYDYDKGQLVTETVIEDREDRSCALGSKVFTTYERDQ